MKIEVQGLVVYLSRSRKDGWRTIERVRLKDWSSLLSELRKTKAPVRVKGKHVQVWYHRARQLRLPFGRSQPPTR